MRFAVWRSGDVRDLVAEHAGELVFGVQQREQPARDVHVTARKRERIGLGLVDQLELPRSLGTLGESGELPADRAHVADHLGVAQQPHLLLDLLGLVVAELLLGRLGDAAS